MSYFCTEERNLADIVLLLQSCQEIFLGRDKAFSGTVLCRVAPGVTTYIHAKWYQHIQMRIIVFYSHVASM